MLADSYRYIAARGPALGLATVAGDDRSAITIGSGSCWRSCAPCRQQPSRGELQHPPGAHGVWQLRQHQRWQPPVPWELATPERWLPMGLRGGPANHVHHPGLLC